MDSIIDEKKVSLPLHFGKFYNKPLKWLKVFTNFCLPEKVRKFFFASINFKKRGKMVVNL